MSEVETDLVPSVREAEAKAGVALPIQGLYLGFRGSGLRSLGFRIQGLYFELRVFRVLGLGCRGSTSTPPKYPQVETLSSLIISNRR